MTAVHAARTGSSSRDTARLARAGRRSPAALAAALLALLTAAEAVGQPPGLFREAPPAPAVAGPGLSAIFDSTTLRRRLVAVDFGQLAPPAGAAPGATGTIAPSGVLQLNLFDDTSFTGLVDRVEPTFSGGYALSGPLAGV